MKKFYFLAMMAMVALSTTSCQKDEFNDAPSSSTVYNNTNSSSTASNKTNNSSFQFSVQVTGIMTTVDNLVGVKKAAADVLRTYYNTLLGSDATVGACDGTFFTISGNNKTAVLNKIKNVSSEDLANALGKVSNASMVHFQVSEGYSTLYDQTCFLTHDKAVAGTWTANLNNTTYTLKVSMDKPNSEDPFTYKATLTVGEKTYEGTFRASSGNGSFNSQDKTLNLRGKFGEDYKTFSATVKANNESLGTATFSKQ